jgi:mannosylglycoprotein endo-beta-mannosidase
MILRLAVLVAALLPTSLLVQSSFAQSPSAQTSTSEVKTIDGWQMQDSAKIEVDGSLISTADFEPQGWYPATVPGTVLTTLVNNHVYPEPLYGENMRAIPESLNKTSYWYRATFTVPTASKDRQPFIRHTWIHFGGINYSAEIWLNGHKAGAMRGAFIRGDFDISNFVKPGHAAVLAVLVSPQPHPGVPHEHTVANGLGANGGETAIDGPTFLSTIGWDWIPAIRDRDTGIWLPVTVDSTGPVLVKDPFVIADLSDSHDVADLHVSTTLESKSAQLVTGTLAGTIRLENSQERNSEAPPITFQKSVTIPASGKIEIALDRNVIPELHISNPRLWWPNGYGPQNLYTVTLHFELGGKTSDSATRQFGIRKIEYQVPDSENLTLSVNGVRVMARGGNWGLDEAMKRISRERLDAQFHMHALANLNIVRNWVGQSTSPDFYDMADKYGILLWDEFFQPNPFDGPDVTDIPTYLANVTDKVVRYRNHPSIAVWCARNEGYPPKTLDETLKSLMAKLDASRLYQSNSADGRGVSSHGPYYWRSPRFFYALNESFKTETGSVSIPTIESIQGMMPQKDWETINDDWAQHDLAAGAQRGDEFPTSLAERYGHIRNLADFVRKGQLATYEAFRAMYEGRNAQMFKATTGVLSWMSSPAQPSFVWQLYHYDLEPNAALYAAKKAAEIVHVQFNEANRGIEVVNNRPEALKDLKINLQIYTFGGKLDPDGSESYPVAQVPGSSTIKAAEIEVDARISPLYFIKLDLTDAGGKLLSTNFYWQHVAQDQFDGLEKLPTVTLDAEASSRTEGENTLLTVTLHNNTSNVALLSHLQLHQKKSGRRVLPVFYSDNYISLVPGESRTVTIEAATNDLAGDQPLVELDGYNVDVKPVEGPVSIALNENAQPSHWPASNIVPDNRQ